MMKRILYIEDESNISGIVKESLIAQGFDVLLRPNGQNILNHIEQFKPLLCLLDVMLPDIDGFELAKKIKLTYPALPIIFITAKSQSSDVVEGFKSGGADYIRKPFSMDELLVRIENQLRNLPIASETNAIPTQEAIAFGNSFYWPNRLELKVAEKSIRISSREAEILNFMIVRPNTPIDRRELMKEVWGDDSYFVSRNLDVYIRRLREYLNSDEHVNIITLKGKGYIFSTENIAES